MKKGFDLIEEGVCSMENFLTGIDCSEEDLEDYVDRNLKCE